MNMDKPNAEQLAAMYPNLNLGERQLALDQAAPWDLPEEKARIIEKFKSYEMTTESSMPIV
jgi:hypothetical protein